MNTQEDSNIVGVTGAKGFIGSHLITYLQQRGITCVPFEGNLLNTEDIKGYFQNNRITKIVHLAGSFNPPFESLINKNLRITQNLLEVGMPLGLKKIIYSSSAAVYGNSPENGSKEEDVLKPNTLYGLVKEYTEECISYYACNNNLSYIILRFPNVYGDGNKKGVIYNLLNDIKTKGGITIEGDGTQKRNFLHVNDVNQAIHKSIDYNENNIFNVGDDKSISLNDLVELLKEKYSFDVVHNPPRDMYSNMILQTQRIKNLIGFQPQITLINKIYTI